jgi:aminoglycoside phosphotransferase (APT) family kinase protein
MTQTIPAADLFSPRADVDDEIARLARDTGLSSVRLLGAGVQFFVYAAAHPRYGEVVIRVPRYDVIDTPNDRYVHSALLAEQEYLIASTLHAQGFPVPRPAEKLRSSSGLPVLISELVTGDSAPPDWQETGRLFARLHDLTPPLSLPTQPAGIALAELIGERLGSRMSALREIRPELPRLPPGTEMAERLRQNAQRASLLHLDIRPSNLICAGGRVRALIDWSNALIGDPRLELARLSEYAQIAENETDETAFRTGYHQAGGLIAAETAADVLYRLDAAVMLALVFLSVVPKPELAPAQVNRVRLLTGRLADQW